MTEPAGQAEAIHAAINQVFGGFTTKWVLVAEIANHDGTIGIQTAEDTSLTPWDRLGLLHFATRWAAIEADDTYPYQEDDV